MTPEALARSKIDALLIGAGWKIQNRAEMNLGEGLGAAVREYPLPAGPCDYLLFVDRRVCGVIEAKPEGQTLTGVAEQSDDYMAALPPHLQSWAPTLLFDYESTGTETLFRDLRDPHPRSRRLFAFHKPATLFESLKKGSSLRGRLQLLPALSPIGLRDCQVDAIAGLEDSLKRVDPRALVQMATGAGKTFTACNLVYRLLAHAGAARILFLVDRKNLGEQTKTEFQRFQPHGTGRLFTELYNVQLLGSRHIDSSSSVVISTIQRIYAALRGEEIEEELDEMSGNEQAPPGADRPVEYNPELPIETFDFVIVDECHRSIYGVWRQVLEYFDAFIIGLTATPSKHTLGYFNQNLVAEYPYERSVADGVNVGYEVFRIKTRIGEHGGLIDADYSVPVRDRNTRRTRYQQLEDDFEYKKEDLDRSVLAPNQIRTVLTAYRDSLPTQLFPGRTEVPKTLIFAKDKFVLIDAVGVTETAKSASQPLERKRQVSFDRLIDQVAAGQRDDDALSSLAGRLAALGGKLTPEDRAKVREVGGKDLQDIARRYLQRFLQSRNGQIIGECVKDGTTVTSIELERLQSFAVPLAPTDEQRRVVAKIEELFGEIEAGEQELEKAREGLAAYRRAVLKAAVTGELTRDWREANARNETGRDLLKSLWRERRERLAGGIAEPKEIESGPLPDLPRGWAWASLEQLTWNSSYGTSVKCSATAEGPAVLRIPNIKRGTIEPVDLKYATVPLTPAGDDWVRPGDLLVIRTNGSERLIGRGGTVCEPLPGLFYFASYLIRFRLLGDPALWRWVSIIWDSPLVRKFVHQNAASSAGQYNISQSKLCRLAIPIPPKSEMRAAVDLAQSQFETADELEAGIDRDLQSAQLRQAVLFSAFSGRLVPQDPSDEPASVLLERLRAEREAASNGRRTRKAASAGKPRRRTGRIEAAP